MIKDASYYRTIILFEQEEIDNLVEVGEQIEDKKDSVFAELYEFMGSHPYFKAHYTVDVVSGAKANETTLWNNVIHFALDEAYVNKQQHFGKVFAAMGVPYEAYLAVILFYHNSIRKAIKEAGLLTPEIAVTMGKISNLSSAVIADTYLETTNKMLMEQNKALMEMSTPVTQLWDGILLLPLVGFIDSKRAQETMTAMLDMISKTQAKVFILDIGGVAVVDTAVANYLIKISKASKLMGCTCLISGISGSVAQTIVELGIQIDEVDTTGNMKEALNRALGVTGAKVVKE